jgi:hypothetical protein
VNTRKFHEIWFEQCDATYEIKLRYGVKAAFDYLVAEKLFNFADAATNRPDVARELPAICFMRSRLVYIAGNTDPSRAD